MPYDETPRMCAVLRDPESGIELKFDPMIPLTEAMAKMQVELTKYWQEKEHASSIKKAAEANADRRASSKRSLLAQQGSVGHEPQAAP